MSADHGAVDLDETSFNLESVDIGDDDVDVVHNELICEDRVGLDVQVGPPPPPPIDEEKKKEFERKRDEVLSGVPEEVKSKFGEIYFSSFGKMVGPVLIMNPYRVEPGPLRSQWLTMFRNCQNLGRESNMTHLTYWYGEFNDLRSAYSFQKTSQLIPYEEGMQITERKFKATKKKRDSGKKLNKKEHKFLKGFEEMERDRPKDPTERYGYVESNFYEEYHILLGEEQVATNEDPPKKAKTKSKKTPKPKTAKPKKTKTKKTKTSAQTNEETTGVVGKLQDAVKGDGETPKPKKKTPKKRIKKEETTIETSRPKKKAKSGEGGEQDSIIPAETKEVKKEDGIDGKDDATAPAKGDDQTVGPIVKAEEKLSAYDEFMALGDVSSHGEADDGSIHMDDLSDDDSKDEDYVENPKAKPTKKKTTKKKTKAAKGPAKSKEPPKKKAQKTKIKVEKSVVREDKNSTSDSNLKKLWRKEQRKFQRCETEFLPLLRRWDKAIGDKNVSQLTKIYEKLLTCMEDFTAPFILEYGMSDLMKRSKGYNNELRKQVLSQFKAIYTRKNGEVPEGFKAVKKSEKNIPLEIKTGMDAEEVDQSKVTQPTKDKQNSEEVVSAKSVSDNPQEAQVTTSMSSSKSRNNDPNKDLGPLSASKSRNSGSNKDLASLVASKSRNSDSNKDLASLSMSKSRKIDSSKDLASLSTSKSRNSDSNRDNKSELSSQKLKRTESKSELTSQKQNTVSAGKPEKKRFSLGNLMRAGSSSSQPSNGGKKLPSSFDESSTLPSRSSKNNQSNPIWTIQVVSNENYSNENRIFGLEFLQQAALYVPGNKSINCDAIARNIESAIFSWSMGKLNGQSMKTEEERWNDYWNKIHDLAACIGGKRKDGTLAKMIGDGKFATPDELVGLDDDDLWSSFQGLPLPNFSK